MVKVNHGWQSNSLEEVETLASQAASPTSSTSTIRRRQGSSASPRMPISAAPSSSAPATYNTNTKQRRKSNTPPKPSMGKPSLAPPAPIQPLSNMPAPRTNARRNSNPHYTPTLLSHSHSASPHTPGHPSTTRTGPKSRNMAEPALYSPHQNVREQDAMEALLFMSSPGNSANIKHAFSPTGSPAPNSVPVKVAPGRHALPSGPRKPLPSQRQPQPNKRTGTGKPPTMPPPGSPMDVDSPQRHAHAAGRAPPRRRINGTNSHLRGALSLPSGLGVGNGVARKVLRDEDIERMLDRAGDADSSDDEEIQIPRRGGGMMQV